MKSEAGSHKSLALASAASPLQGMNPQMGLQLMGLRNWPDDGHRI